MSAKILNDQEVLAQVHHLVGRDKIAWTTHIQLRMAERGYDKQQVKKCLLNGQYTERPTIPNRGGQIEYCFRMGAKVDAEYIEVAASLVPDRNVVAITVIKT